MLRRIVHGCGGKDGQLSRTQTIEVAMCGYSIDDRTGEVLQAAYGPR